MRSEIRSAAIGGLAATFVVAAAFAPKLLSHPTEQAFHQTSAVEVPADEPSTTTTTLAPPPTTTTTEPTTTTAPREIVERVVVVEKQVADVDQRVTAIEQQTGLTTTTTARPADPAVVFAGVTPDGIAHFSVDRIVAGLAVQFRVTDAAGAVTDHEARFFTGIGEGGLASIAVPTSDTVAVAVVGWSWDGGSHPAV